VIFKCSFLWIFPKLWPIDFVKSLNIICGGCNLCRHLNIRVCSVHQHQFSGNGVWNKFQLQLKCDLEKTRSENRHFKLMYVELVQHNTGDQKRTFSHSGPRIGGRTLWLSSDDMPPRVASFFVQLHRPWCKIRLLPINWSPPIMRWLLKWAAIRNLCFFKHILYPVFKILMPQ
jgi:hypothetical protein